MLMTEIMSTLIESPLSSQDEDEADPASYIAAVDLLKYLQPLRWKS
jgi:hypothetical protein